MNQLSCFLAGVVVVAGCVTSSATAIAQGQTPADPAGAVTTDSTADPAATPATGSRSPVNDVAEVNASLERLVAAVSAKDVNGIMAYYVPDESLLVFDALLPRQYFGAAAHRKNWESFMARYPSTVHAEASEWKAETAGNLAYGHGIFRIAGPSKDGKPLDVTVRFTNVFRKIDGKWLAIHEHVSWPVDLATGKADLSSKP